MDLAQASTYYARYSGGAASRGTYSYGGENILELVYEGNETGVIDVDAADRLVSPWQAPLKGLQWGQAHAVGLTAMAGDGSGFSGEVDRYRYIVRSRDASEARFWGYNEQSECMGVAWVWGVVSGVCRIWLRT